MHGFKPLVHYKYIVIVTANYSNVTEQELQKVILKY